MLLTRKLYPISSLRFWQLSAKLIMRGAIIIRVSICYCSLPLVTILCIHAPNQLIGKKERQTICLPFSLNKTYTWIIIAVQQRCCTRLFGVSSLDSGRLLWGGLLFAQAQENS